MFRGIDSVSLDAKGRMALPARYRDGVLSECDGRLVVTIDTREKCLLLYPLPEWEEVQARVARLANIKESARLLQRLLVGYATDIELDGSGRVRVPPVLRDFAGLTKKLMLVGQINKIEIWSEAQWQERMDTWLEERSGLLDDSDELTGLSV